MATKFRESASLPVPARHRPRGTPRPSQRSRARALVLVLVHAAILIHVAHWKVTGATWTPMEPSEAMQTLELGYVNAGFLLFAAATLATLVLGRFFCGWACHVVAYQDLCAWLLKKVGLRPRPVRSRLLVFVPLGAALYMFVWPQVARLLEGRAFPGFELHLTTTDLWATFPGPWVATLTLLVDGFLVVWLLGAKGFCTYGCPYGAVFGLADRASRGRIRVTDACQGCGHCTATCTSNVEVHAEVARYGQVVDTGCMKCLD
jgi:polyferredoxin